MSSLFNIGLSGLSAASNAMYLTANNIANANNPFYSRRVIDFVEVTSSLFGAGVTLGDVRRISDAFIDKQLLTSKTDVARIQTVFENLKNLENKIDKDQTSVSNFINASLDALQSLNINVTSVQGRSFYLNCLTNMTNRINSVSSNLNQESANTQVALSQVTNQANDILNQLADLNSKIKAQSAPNSMNLIDQRDKLLDSLAGIIQFTSQVDEFGSTRILLSNGLPLLEGNQIAKLSVARSDTVPNGLDIIAENSGSSTVITHIIGGGKVTGLIDYNNNHISLLQNKLNKLAIAIGFNMNAQNKLGIDSQGNLGGNIFNDINNPSSTAERCVPNPTNQGSMNMAVLITDPKKLTDSNYRFTFDTPGHYSLVRTLDGTVVSEGSLGNAPTSIAVDGFTLDISQFSEQAGDSYFIYPTLNAANLLHVQIANGGQLALGFPVAGKAFETNIGSGEISVSGIIDTNNSAFSIPQKLNPPVLIEFISANTYRIRNADDNSILEDNLIYNSDFGADVFPTPGGYDPGYRIHLSGNMQAGDVFSVDYNIDGIGDNRNGLLLAQLYSTGTLESGQLTFTEAYHSLLFELASSVNSASNNYDANNMLLLQLQSVRDVTSGVSLEEETMNLTRLQDNYLANAQVLQAAKSTLESIFALFRG